MTSSVSLFHPLHSLHLYSKCIDWQEDIVWFRDNKTCKNKIISSFLCQESYMHMTHSLKNSVNLTVDHRVKQREKSSFKTKDQHESGRHEKWREGRVKRREKSCSTDKTKTEGKPWNEKWRFTTRKTAEKQQEYDIRRVSLKEGLVFKEQVELVFLFCR